MPGLRDLSRLAQFHKTIEEVGEDARRRRFVAVHMHVS